MEAQTLLLTVKLTLLTLAVVALAVAPLHHTTRPRPVVAAGPLHDRLVVLEAQAVPGLLLGERDGLSV